MHKKCLIREFRVREMTQLKKAQMPSDSKINLFSAKIATLVMNATFNVLERPGLFRNQMIHCYKREVISFPVI